MERTVHGRLHNFSLQGSCALLSRCKPRSPCAQTSALHTTDVKSQITSLVFDSNPPGSGRTQSTSDFFVFIILLDKRRAHPGRHAPLLQHQPRPSAPETVTQSANPRPTCPTDALGEVLAFGRTGHHQLLFSPRQRTGALILRVLTSLKLFHLSDIVTSRRYGKLRSTLRYLIVNNLFFPL
jgi:hypothetical protein